MAVLDASSRTGIRAFLCRKFGYGVIGKSDVQAAVEATDDWIDANVAAFNAALPVAARTTMTTQEKTVLFCYVALKRAGIEV